MTIFTRIAARLPALPAAIMAIGAVLLPGMAAASTVYMPNFGDGTLSLIDTTTNTVTATIGLVGTNPEGIAVTPDGRKVLVALRGGTSAGDPQDGLLDIIDTATNRVVDQIPTAPGPIGIVVSPDGTKAYFVNDNFGTTANLWQVDLATGTVARMLPINAPNAAPFNLAISPDGTTLYVVGNNGPVGNGLLQFVDIATASVIATAPLGVNASGIAVTPDGSQLYVANFGDGTVTAIATGPMGLETILAVGNGPFGIAATPDGKQIWVANDPDGTISVIDTATNQVTTTFPAGAGPSAVGFTPDGATAYVPNSGIGAGGDSVSVIDTSSQQVTGTVTVGAAPLAIGNFIGAPPAPPPPAALLSAVLPDSRSVEIGRPATIFATLSNATSGALDNCQIGLTSAAPAGLSLTYQTTDPATNALTGHPDTPVAIAAAAAQSFLLTFTSDAAFDQPGLPLAYRCDAVAEANSTLGLNTVDLLFSQTLVPDLIALAATATPGVLTVPFIAPGPASFAVATANVGAAGTLTVTADTGSAALPLDVAICRSNPKTAACLSPAATTISVDFAAGETASFSCFVTATAAIPFDPAQSRLFIRFEDGGGIAHGSTSVAVETD
jgi:YVTN family beta-propeller protein